MKEFHGLIRISLYVLVISHSYYALETGGANCIRRRWNFCVLLVAEAAVLVAQWCDALFQCFFVVDGAVSAVGLVYYF